MYARLTCCNPLVLFCPRAALRSREGYANFVQGGKFTYGLSAETDLPTCTPFLAEYKLPKRGVGKAAVGKVASTVGTTSGQMGLCIPNV